MTRAALLLLLILATAVAQVAVAPFFPILGAVVELPIVVLLLLAVFAGPYAVMAGLPVLVLFLGFATNLEYEWFVLAYLPILPATAFIQRQFALPRTPYALLLLIAIGAAVWARAVFALAAVASGATPALGAVVVDILLPGAVFDAIVLSIAYALGRWLGWPVRSLELREAEYQA